MENQKLLNAGLLDGVVGGVSKADVKAVATSMAAKIVGGLLVALIATDGIVALVSGLIYKFAKDDHTIRAGRVFDACLLHIPVASGKCGDQWKEKTTAEEEAAEPSLSS